MSKLSPRATKTKQGKINQIMGYLSSFTANAFWVILICTTASGVSASGSDSLGVAIGLDSVAGLTVRLVDAVSFFAIFHFSCWLIWFHIWFICKRGYPLLRISCRKRSMLEELIQLATLWLGKIIIVNRFR